jgi:predicted ATPase/DNA-binding SARP family transcriptional activator
VLSLLGPVEIGRPGFDASRALAGRERALLVRLALDLGRAVSVERLIDDLWGDAPPAGARNTLQSYVSHLRRHLGADAILSGVGGYTLVPTAVSVDVPAFSELVAAGVRAAADQHLHEAAQALDQAVKQWRGEPLSDLTDYQFARVEAARLAEIRGNAVESLAEVELALGHPDRVVAELGSLVREFPFRERLVAAVMTALYRQGRAVEALALYRDERELLREELGLDPGPTLQSLQRAILADDAGLVATAPHAREAVGAMHPPVPSTALFGRAEETAGPGELLGRQGVRLATVLGPGGAGKTRLAIEIANTPPPVFLGAVVRVPLVGVDDSDRVLTAIGTALRMQASQLEVADIVAALGDRPALLVFDNAEHLLPGIARLISVLLAECAQLSILVTSRVALRMKAEHRFLVGALPVPAPDSDLDSVRANPAVQLFVERAAHVQPGFMLEIRNVEAVVGICTRLDGLPLALELAAARTGLLGPAEMLARLQSRLGMLTAGQGETEDRHRALRATLDWSYRLLTPLAARLLETLAVFRSGFTLEAAEQVAKVKLDHFDEAGDARLDAVAVLDALQELLDSSLITRDPRRAGRFLMLQTVREYAAERLAESGDEPALRDAHCGYFRDVVASLYPGVPIPMRTLAEVEWFHRERHNLRTAILWAVSRGDAERLADLATGTWYHWTSTGDWQEAERWLEQVAGDTAAGIRQVDAEHLLASGAGGRSISDALDHLGRALSLLTDDQDDAARRAVIHAQRSLLLLWSGRAEAAAQDGAMAVAAADATTDLDARAVAMATSYVGFYGGQSAERALLFRAREAAAAAGNDYALGIVLNNLAEFALADRKPDEALRLCSGALEAFVGRPTASPTTAVRNIMAGAWILTGDLARARPVLRGDSQYRRADAARSTTR